MFWKCITIVSPLPHKFMCVLFLLQTVGIGQEEGCGGLNLHNIHMKINENQSSGSEVERGHTHTA